MTQQTISARAKPIREPQPGQRTCTRCGIQQGSKETGPEYYCLDCKPDARTLGWLPPVNNYTCQNCGVQRKGTGRTLCAKCDWNLSGKKKPKPKPEPKPAKEFEPCGTRAAHKRHISNGEPSCGPCTQAKNAYDKGWRAKRVLTPEQLSARKERDRIRYLRKKGRL